MEKGFLKFEISDDIYPLTNLTKDKYEIKDHINLSGFNPLKGPKFVSMTNLYKSRNGIIVEKTEWS